MNGYPHFRNFYDASEIKAKFIGLIDKPPSPPKTNASCFPILDWMPFNVEFVQRPKITNSMLRGYPRSPSQVPTFDKSFPTVLSLKITKHGG